MCFITVNVRKNFRRHLRDVEKIVLKAGLRGRSGKLEETNVSDLVLCSVERYT
jgi:hypothetical protein